MLESLASQAVKLLTNAVAGKWKANREVHEKVELCKRRIRATRVSGNIYRELYGLRQVFLDHDLGDKYDVNRRFFDKWLTDPVVEMGWAPSAVWTQAKIFQLHRGLEEVSA